MLWFLAFSVVPSNLFSHSSAAPSHHFHSLSFTIKTSHINARHSLTETLCLSRSPKDKSAAKSKSTKANKPAKSANNNNNNKNNNIPAKSQSTYNKNALVEAQSIDINNAPVKAQSIDKKNALVEAQSINIKNAPVKAQSMNSDTTAKSQPTTTDHTAAKPRANSETQQISLVETEKENVNKRCILVGAECSSIAFQESMQLKRRAKSSQITSKDFKMGNALVAFDTDMKGALSLANSLQELSLLAETAGLLPVGDPVTQRLSAPVAGTYVGPGKVEEIKQSLMKNNAKICLFDDELSPAQQRNLEQELGGEKKDVQVMDRTWIILDIFAQRARTKEGKLQVELAMCKYQKPRLTKMWTHLSRQSGSGATRGPGETQLEVDRRLIAEKISLLTKQIEEVAKKRETSRKARQSSNIPRVCIVGYTNAGKSTLMNSFTIEEETYVEDKLFATLDTTTRKIDLPGSIAYSYVLLTDTVGFIQKLPTQLVAAFRSTLEEALEGDILIHVVDGCNPCYRAHIDTVNVVLASLGAADKPQILLLNKYDKDPILVEERIKELREGSNVPVLGISATTKLGQKDLVEQIEATLKTLQTSYTALIPYSEGKLISEAHREGVVETEEHRNEGTYIVGSAPPVFVEKLRKYIQK